MSTLFVVSLGMAGIWGFLTLLGSLSQYKRCAGCRYDGDVSYMDRDEHGNHWHPSCLVENRSLR